MKVMDFYLIHAISNLHVGSGEGDFSVIDKQVQRDPNTELPTIHSSGIKGALRELMAYSAGKDPVKIDEVEKVFGSNPKDRKTIKQGKFNFFEGRLLALPARSSHDFFYLVTCPNLLEEFIGALNQFKYKNKYLDDLSKLVKEVNDGAVYFGVNQGPTFRLEEKWEPHHNSTNFDHLTELFGDRLAVLPNDDFKTLAKELPIIARNYLENGVSSNLWYEEFVPREARFFTMVSREENEDYLNTFLQTKDNLVQLGANATVGYGLCSFKKLN